MRYSSFSLLPALTGGVLMLVTWSAAAQGFRLVQCSLEPALARVNRPGQITVVIQNTNTASAHNVTLQVNLPAGTVGPGGATVLTSTVPHWPAGARRWATWDVQSSVAANTTGTVQVKEGASTRLNTSFPVWWHPTLAINPAGYVPAPTPAGAGRYLVGAIACPFWRSTGHSSIYDYPDRKPILGFFDEGDAEPTDWQTKWALDNGISFFAPCWYREPGNVGLPHVVPQHSRWLEGGFLNSRYGSQIKFAIMSVGDIVNSKEDLVQHVFPYWLANYFTRSNYLVLDNKPVIFFFSSPLSPTVMSNALTEMRAAAVTAGFAGLTVFGCNNGFFGGSTTNNQWMKDSAMDYSYAYHVPTFMGTLSSATPTALEVIQDHQQVWDNQQAGVVPHVITVSSGWNSEPWGNSVSSTKWRLTPSQYGTVLQNAKTELNSRTNASSGLDTQIVLLDNWDEWGEGHFIGVTREYAWGYLEAVRQVFGTNLTTSTNLGPQDIGRGTPYYDGLDRERQVLASVGQVVVSSGGTAAFDVFLGTPPAHTLTVTNWLSADQTNAAITDGASMTFTPANWNLPQTVTITGLAPTTRKVQAFSSAGGNSGYCDDWVQVIVHAASTNAPSSGSWTTNANGNWSTAGNWHGGSVPAGDNATAFFTNATTGSRTVTVDGSPGIIREMVFSPSGGNNWTLSGGSIQLAPSTTITVSANTATINSFLKGESRLVKTGAGTLTLGATNNYTGGTLVQAGTLRGGAASSTFGSGAITILEGATVDAGGRKLDLDLLASGNGVGGNGAIVNTSGAQAQFRDLVLLGDLTVRDVFGGMSAFGHVSGGGRTLTVLGNGTAGYFGLGRGQSDLGDINVVSGALYANGYVAATAGCLGRATNLLTLAASGTLGFIRNGNAVHDKRMVSNGGRFLQSQGGSPELLGPIILNASSRFDVENTLIVSGAISGAGGLIKNNGGILALAASNTYSGATTLNDGTLQVAHPLALQNSTMEYSIGTLSFGGLTNAMLGGFSGNRNLSLVNSGSTGVQLRIGNNDSSTTYSGNLSGPGGITKLGSGTFILSGANTYTGGTTVEAGILQAGSTNAFGLVQLTVQEGGTVEFDGRFLSAQDVVAIGDGVDDNGALVNSSVNQARLRNLTLNGDLTLRSMAEGLNVMGTVTGNGRALTVLGDGTSGYVGIGNGASDLGDINIVSGRFYANGYIGGVSGSLGRATNTVTVFGLGTLGFPNNGSAAHNKRIVLEGGRIYQLLGGSPTLQGPITLHANSIIEVTDTLTLSGPLDGTAGFTKTGAGALVLSGTNTHAGDTVIENGTVQLAATGAVVGSASLAVFHGATLNVAAVPGGFVLGPGQTLSGNGTVLGNLTAQGAVSPGISIGRLTHTGNVTLGGVALMELEKSGGIWTNDQLTATGTLNYGGTLVVTNLGGGVPALGDSFKLFNASGYGGAFTNLMLPALAGGLAWTNRLTVDGTLAVVTAVSMAPVPLEFTLNGSTLQLSWPADHIGWRLEAQTNLLAAGIGTNWFTVDGSTETNSLSLPVNVTNDSVFYRLSYP